MRDSRISISTIHSLHVSDRCISSRLLSVFPVVCFPSKQPPKRGKRTPHTPPRPETPDSLPRPGPPKAPDEFLHQLHQVDIRVWDEALDSRALTCWERDQDLGGPVRAAFCGIFGVFGFSDLLWKSLSLFSSFPLFLFDLISWTNKDHVVYAGKCRFVCWSSV